MREYGHNGEDHPSEVAVGIADEDSSRVPIVIPESERDTDEG